MSANALRDSTRAYGSEKKEVRLCLSISDYHPESWNPAWTVETILLGLVSFMVDPADPPAVRAGAALVEFNCGFC